MGVTKQAHKPAKTVATRSRTREWLPRAAKSKAKVTVSEDENEETQLEEEEAPTRKSRSAKSTTQITQGRQIKRTRQTKRTRQAKPTRQTKRTRQTKQSMKGKQIEQARQTAQPEIEDDDSDDDSNGGLDDDSDSAAEEADSRQGAIAFRGMVAQMTQDLIAQSAKNKAPMTTCMTCYTPQKEEDMMKSSEVPDSCRGCYKNICRDCMETYLDRYFFQTTVSVKSVAAQCPFCRSEWDLPRMENILGKDRVNVYLERMTHRTLETSPTFRWCAADRCTSGQFYIPDEQLKDGNVKICCGVCESVNCYDCRTPWHEGIGCKENQDPDLRKHRSKRAGDVETTKVMRKSETRRCPSCSIAVEKTSGCDHVFCTTCGKDFMFSTAARV